LGARIDDTPDVASATPAADATTGGVLYVEDNPANVRLVERVLAQRGGLRLLTSAEGAPTLALARRHRPDIILLDLHLPDVGGEAILRPLRAAQLTAATPVIILTADATPAPLEPLRRAAAHDHLANPHDATQLQGNLR